MGTTKKTQYKQYEIDIANIYKALGHPARVRIIELLINSKGLNVTTISFELQLSWATTSHHLAILYENGLIGQVVTNFGCHFILNQETMEYIENHLDWVQNSFRSSQPRFETVYFKPSLRSEF